MGLALRNPKGVALATVMSLVSLVLVIGLALGTVSTMELNLSRQDYLKTRAALAARSGVTELIARVGQLESQRQIQLFNPQNLDLAQAFPPQDGDPRGCQLVEGCWVNFNPQLPRYSTDNSMSSQACSGWLDHGTGRTSVPPYTLELILHAEVGGFQKDFRALVRRTWPYAVYSAGGPVVLAGDPDHPGQGTNVTGDVYAYNLAYVDFASQPNPLNMAPDWQLFYCLTQGYSAVEDNDHPFFLGPPIWRSPIASTVGGSPPASLPADRQATFVVHADSPNASDLVLESTDTGNTLTGNVDYQDATGRKLTALVTSGNRWSGQLRNRNLARNPLADQTLPAADHYQGVACDGQTLVAGSPILLQGDLTLGQDSSPGYFLISGNVTNHYTQHALTPDQIKNSTTIILNPDFSLSRDGLTVEEFGGGLKLQNCLLYVNGDLNLTDLGHPAFHGIQGNGATMVVNGTLALTGGTLNAGDQGMVIFAKDLILSGSGDFSGLLVASNSLAIVPQGGQRMRIRGGIVTASHASVEDRPGVILHNVDLTYDPRYLKSLNVYGQYQLSAWEPL